MKSFISLFVAAALAAPALAHYRFYELIVNGAATAQYQYVRANTNTNSPVMDLTSTDLRCNVGGLASGSTTQTSTVAAGATVGFQVDIGIIHPGPVIAYLAKVPSGQTAQTYGSGSNWFKIYEQSGTFSSAGITWYASDKSTFTFKIPSTIAAGEYLLRIEHIALHSASTEGQAQFYISCAQLKITGGGSTTPPNKVALPGAYKSTDPGLLINLYWPIPTSYTIPGPTIFTG